MPSRKCCVTNCESTSRTHRLFNIPKQDNLRDLWLSFLIPVNVELSGLTKYQLVCKKVCHKHFDRYQFDQSGNRLAHGYPSLFSPEEIHHGIPLATSVQNHLGDHNYSSMEYISMDVEQSCTEVPSLDEEGDHSNDKSDLSPIPKSEPRDAVAFEETVQSSIEPPLDLLTGDHSNDKPDLSPISTSEPPDVMAFEQTVQTSIEPPLDLMLTEEASDVSCVSSPSSCIAEMDEDHSLENKVPITEEASDVSCVSSPSSCIAEMDEDHSLENKVPITVNKREKQDSDKPFAERIAEAQQYSKENIFEIFTKISKNAQDYLMTELKQVVKEDHSARFTVDEKLLALTLMKGCPKGYRLLQKLFNLPAKRTLNRLTKKIDIKSGINNNIFQLLESKAKTWNTAKTLCSIVFDEIALNPHLSVESHIEGQRFEDLEDESSLKCCDRALVFMIRGICSNWRQLIGYYLCESTIPAFSLVHVLKEVVAHVAQAGLLPIALICDQASIFGTAIILLRQETIEKRILCNEIDDGTVEIACRQLSIVYDPPHLLKDLRNNFIAKNMIFNGRIASWNDIVTVHKLDCQLGNTRLNKNLTEQHIRPSEMNKIKVSVAAQAMSAKTSAMLKYTSLFGKYRNGEPVSKTMATTGNAVEFIDKLFDSVNGSHKSITKGKLRGPIEPNSGHFQFWHEAKRILNNMKFVDAGRKITNFSKNEYSVNASLDGWTTTIESMERISKLLHEGYDVGFFYPRNLNQDPLENFLGSIKSLNHKKNPDASIFTNAFKSFLISNVMGPYSINADCEDENEASVIEFHHLLQSS